MKDKDVKLGILKSLMRSMGESDKPKLMSISVEKVSPVKVAKNDDLIEEGKEVVKGLKEEKGKEEKPGRRDVESDDMDMFKELLRKKGRKL